MGDVSVVMCTYNGAEFLEAQLDSIIQQSMPPLEILVCDDGSLDSTVQIARRIGESSKVPIRIYENDTRLGFADNFLAGCDRSRGRYISFSDQDDVWSKQKLERAYQALTRERAELCVHPVRQVDVRGMPLESSLPKRQPNQIINRLESDPWGNFYGFTMLFDRTLLDKLPSGARGADPYTQDAILSHDRWIYFLACTFGRTVVLGECLVDYRQHEAQAYGGPKPRSLRERLSMKLSSGGQQARDLATIAAHRASLLETLMPVGDSTWEAGATRWRRIEFHLQNRVELFGQVSRRARLKLLYSNLRNGAYLSFKNGGLGHRKFFEDVVITSCLDLG